MRVEIKFIDNQLNVKEMQPLQKKLNADHA
jgi:hypothetical protein